jgi:hypothetical protein
MKPIYNFDLFESMKRKPCLICGARKTKENNEIIDPHHKITTKMGGQDRLDVPENLIPLCRRCHDAVHAGQKAFTSRLKEVGLFSHLSETVLFRDLKGRNLDKNKLYSKYRDKAEKEIDGYSFKKDEYVKVRKKIKIESRGFAKDKRKRKVDGTVVCRYCGALNAKCDHL